MPPLCNAIANSAIVRLLLEKGADPDAGRGAGFTPLMYAVWLNYHESIELLLKYGASTEFEHSIPSLAGWTAMTCAASYGDEKTVRLLAEAGSDLLKKDAQGIPLLHRADKRPQFRVLLEHVSRIDLNQRDSDGRTVLHLGELPLETFRRLFNAGANLKAKAKDGSTPLAVAAWEGKTDIVEYLLKGANMDTASVSAGSPLHLACQRRCLRAVELLVEMVPT